MHSVKNLSNFKLFLILVTASWYVLLANCNELPAIFTSKPDYLKSYIGINKLAGGPFRTYSSPSLDTDSNLLIRNTGVNPSVELSSEGEMAHSFDPEYIDNNARVARTTQGGVGEHFHEEDELPKTKDRRKILINLTELTHSNPYLLLRSYQIGEQQSFKDRSSENLNNDAPQLGTPSKTGQNTSKKLRANAASYYPVSFRRDA
ncbi:hypothetical protein PPACK8108_LOCUS24027 [Phakopsora pachyrhizi]|uniref:Secreted protein n=1 Tax=Phakopsora pachyrhizi TaxID=170000 RepID=A0AAV0BRR8_PHAPC|nr:hypothetical protein PPACK8108_LOCUS24027 [Phakopsora pachyrhizi]